MLQDSEAGNGPAAEVKGEERREDGGDGDGIGDGEGWW